VIFRRHWKVTHNNDHFLCHEYVLESWKHLFSHLLSATEFGSTFRRSGGIGGSRRILLLQKESLKTMFYRDCNFGFLEYFENRGMARSSKMRGHLLDNGKLVSFVM
jgi:hypothetical protein